MKSSLALLLLFLSACATSNFAPPTPISPGVIARARADGISAAQVSAGRNLFVTRCLECHTLPPVSKYTPEEWPRLVARMAGRANLSGDQAQFLTGYLRAAASDRESPKQTLSSF